ncbi:MAG TPA: glycosyltransferase family 4 protein [Thermoflexia bacterium]|jgi:glycosyltransferase involved in cell wall biosynthesis|nr:glycosyltransferase family 4 protein [Thermoflexia bacterium]
MRVLLITAYFPPDTGSAAHLFYELGKALVACGLEVLVITALPGYHAQGDLSRYRGRFWLEETLDGVRVARTDVWRFFRNAPIGRGLWQFSCALNFAVRGLVLPTPDVALVYSPPLPLGLTAWMFQRLRRVPFILNVQDLFPQSAIDLGVLKNALLIRLFRSLERFVYHRADLITVHSPGNQEYIVGCGIDKAKITVVHNWIDTEFIRPGERRNAFSRQYGLDGKFVVSFAGVIGYSQDIDVVLEAADLLRGWPEIHFLIVGDGVEKVRLEQKAREMGLPNVQFLPMQPRHRYPAVLQASDVSLATLHAEVATPVVPSKILSIMAAGRPVIACMNLDGDAPRLIEEAQCGYALPPEDPQALAEAVLTLYRDAALREQFGLNGRRYAEKYLSVQAGADRYIRLFERLLAKRT